MVTTASSTLAGQTALSPTSQRLITTLAAAIGKDTRNADKLERERRAAIAALVDDWLAVQDEPARVAFFAFIEGTGTTLQRKRIATHPLRPAAVDAVRAKAEAEREASAVKTAKAAQG